jgi:hypothetical protein
VVSKVPARPSFKPFRQEDRTAVMNRVMYESVPNKAKHEARRQSCGGGQ